MVVTPLKDEHCSVEEASLAINKRPAFLFLLRQALAQTSEPES
jgi:hypothetical protein